MISKMDQDILTKMIPVVPKRLTFEDRHMTVLKYYGPGI